MDIAPLITILFFITLIYLYYKPSKRICKDCGFVGKVRKTTEGNTLIEIILWLTIVLGLIYTIWRFSNRVYCCPSCGKKNMIPIDSPVAIKLLQEQVNKESNSIDKAS